MSLDNPTSILFDVNGLEMAVSQSQSVSGTRGLILAGWDDTQLARFMNIDVSGSTRIQGSYVSGSTLTTASRGVLMGGRDSSNLFQTFRMSTDGSVFITGSLATTPSGVQTITGTVAQGAAGSITSGWYMRITDGTNVLGTGSSSPLWVSGAVTVTNTVTVTGSVALSQTAVVRNETYSTATHTAVPRSATSVTLLAANSNRRFASIYNDTTGGNASLYVAFAASATTAAYIYKLGISTYWEVPGWYTGIITGIWQAAGSGNAVITEI